MPKHMKQLIEKSIKLRGLGRPDNKTIFNIEKECEKMMSQYTSIEIISGRKMPVDYTYTENNVETTERMNITIPSGLNENEIKEFILSEINKKINI